MAKITHEQIHIVYELAKSTYLGNISRSAVVRTLCDDCGFNEGSASDYVTNLARMLKGSVYHRTMNIYATEYFLGRISDDFSASLFQNALSAVEQHLNYYDTLGRGNQLKIRQLLDSYRASVSGVGHLEVPLDFGFRRLGALGSSVGCAFCSLIFG
jgi:5-methylcytosine-specific restriction protein A